MYEIGRSETLFEKLNLKNVLFVFEMRPLVPPCHGTENIRKGDILK